MPSVGIVYVKYDAVILLPWQQLVDVVKVSPLSVLIDFGIAPRIHRMSASDRALLMSRTASIYILV